MFKLIDNYILKKFLGTFVFTMLVITVIAVVIDTSEKADGNVQEIVMNHFGDLLPLIA